MTRKLNFTPVEEVNQKSNDAAFTDAEYRPRRWKSRDVNPVVQMSIRMPEETYERFRTLCQRERRTNGDMLRILMEGHFAREEEPK